MSKVYDTPYTPKGGTKKKYKTTMVDNGGVSYYDSLEELSAINGRPISVLKEAVEKGTLLSGLMKIELNTPALYCKATDTDTGEVKEFKTASDAKKFFDVKTSTLKTWLKDTSKIRKEKYLISK